MVAMAVLGLISVIRVRRAVFLLHLVVGARPLVAAADQQGNRHPGGEALEHAREDLDLVVLLARRGNVALARAAAVEVGLDIVGGQRQPRRAAVDHDAHGRPVAFAPGGDAEKVAEAVMRHAGGLVRSAPARRRGWGCAGNAARRAQSG